MQLLRALRKHSLLIGIIGMLLVIAGTIVEAGSLLQKFLFLIGCPTLGFCAWLGGQKMFTSLQLVAILSAITAFFPLALFVRCSLLIAPAIAAIAYLGRVGYWREDKLCPIGITGLLILALGLSIQAELVLLFYALLAAAGILISLYSALRFLFFKDKIALLWLILNIIFTIPPLSFILALA